MLHILRFRCNVELDIYVIFDYVKHFAASYVWKVQHKVYYDYYYFKNFN